MQRLNLSDNVHIERRKSGENNPGLGKATSDSINLL